MIKLFRRIRHKLIEEGTLKRYLIYASGEILLVTIGILLALQINNWNEKNKNKDFEKEILTQIRANLIKDKITLKQFAANGHNAMTSIEKLLDKNLIVENNDSLKYWLGDVVQFDRFLPLTNAYEVLKSKGLDLISNKQLRFLLGTYYDDDSNLIIKACENIEFSFTNDWLPILKENVREQRFKEFLILETYEGLKMRGQIRNLLILNKDNWRGSTKYINEGVMLIDKILETIKKEIN